jgi:ABC-type nitrate/sulfonate/bicarbonate transport system substrate-binding protein
MALLTLLCAHAPLRAQSLISLHVRFVEVDSTKLPLLVAYEDGIFRKHGLDVKFQISPSAQSIAMRRDIYIPPEFVGDDPAPISMGGGFGIAKLSTVAVGFAGGFNPDSVILATLDPLIHWPIVGIPEIRRPEDLKGRRITRGRPGDEVHVIGLVMCQQMKWDCNQELSLLDADPDLFSLRRGMVDAIIASEVPYATALTAGLGYHVIMETKSWKVPIPGSGVNVPRAWLRDNRDTAMRYLKSIVEGIAVMRKDPAKANRAMAKWFNITNPAHQKIIYDGTADLERKPYPSVEGVKMMMQLYDSHEMRKYKAEQFYDSSLMEEIDKSGFIDSLYK